MNATAFTDQLNAATRDALTALAGAGTTRQVDPDTVPWVAEQVTTLRLAFLSGQARCCPHLGPSPQIAHAAAWAPGQLVCSACTWRLVPDDAEDSTCDRCRRHASPIYAAAAAVGPILLGYGLCADCKHAAT